MRAEGGWREATLSIPDMARPHRVGVDALLDHVQADPPLARLRP
jgi:hypothetical protein